MDGTELIGRFPEVEPAAWMHVLFPALDGSRVQFLADQLRAPIPRSLRKLLRTTGGMTLFAGAFRIAGWSSPDRSASRSVLRPDDLLTLNHELDLVGWKPPGAVAFAVNSHDRSVHLLGMTNDPEAVLRCDRDSGVVLDQHADVLACLADRLTSLEGSA
jgi:hypothetical protein